MDNKGTVCAAVLLVLQFYLPAVYCDGHTLTYHITMTNIADPALPQYSVTGYMDGLPIGKYNSDIRHTEFLIPSLNKFTDHLEKLTKYAQQWEVQQTRKMNFLMGFLNKTDGHGDFHVYQRKFACELHKDGTIGGYQEITFDGKEIITFDKEREVFVPATQEAVIMVQQWNKYQGNAKENRLYMENECIHQMKMYMAYVTAKLGKKVQPNENFQLRIRQQHHVSLPCLWILPPRCGRKVDKEWER